MSSILPSARIARMEDEREATLHAAEMERLAHKKKVVVKKRKINKD